MSYCELGFGGWVGGWVGGTYPVFIFHSDAEGREELVPEVIAQLEDFAVGGWVGGWEDE